MQLSPGVLSCVSIIAQGRIKITKQTFSEELLFQKIHFLEHRLVINPTNTRVFGLKSPWGAQKIFLLIP